MAVMLRLSDQPVCVLVAALFSGLAIEVAAAADVRNNKAVTRATMIQRHDPVTVAQQYASMVPFCLEMPTWLFGRPVLLKCTQPRYYFKPDTAGTLDEVKAFDPRPKPYVMIRPTYP